ncbi:septum formation protein [Bifidobacterium commune]|uniref:Nucleoside triphosphate pyrophosphatase n=1 Tax=Bifidobacterium commune TaxID=1505727 RepID=A0A1C4H5G1_9BIFI|nr:Maf family protein [Bifidobacterium commune]MBB2955874.1 septum formation protein [Bifidobacterium commune]SCC80033.1 septum formation protein [Bifidobacterium commune]
MSISLILASKSPSRRNVLNAAGISPTIHVSHVDEPAVLAFEAKARGVSIDDLTCEQRVMILARAKAASVYEAYCQVAETARNADGEQVIAYPLRAEEVGLADTVSAGSQNVEAANGDATTLTRDFSGVSVPTETESMTLAEARQPGFTDAAVGPLIVGCDSMFLFEGESLGKPHTPEVARERLSAMHGKSGELWTGHCLIDFATGRQELASSHAIVRFGDYSDRDIEGYVASGEPLEVAGCFTLEGLGGAFIDGIDGDPSGVLGLSLPLLRRMVKSMGVDWADLWNAGLGKVASANLARQSDGATNSTAADAVTAGQQATSVIPPKDNVHQPGDGWVQCACGRRHWGMNGAAGVLLARRSEETGEVTHIVMQHRALWSAEGGTWGIPGGALADGESPIEGALRESYEEANITPEDIEVVGTYREEHGPWAYTTVFAFERPGRSVDPHANDDESMAIEWVPVDEVPKRKLLTAMHADWPNFIARLNHLAQEKRSQ